MRSWLYKIATNRCLNALRDSAGARRPRPDRISEPPARARPAGRAAVAAALPGHAPRRCARDAAPGPEARDESREALALAFVAGLQRLPPRQRAVLVLRDVLGYPAAEAAQMLETSQVSVNSALQRARATLGGQPSAPAVTAAPAPRSPREREIVSRFVDAFEAADIERLVSVLTDDAAITTPAEPLEYQGHAAIAEFYVTRTWWGARPIKLVPTRANGRAAFGGIYLQDAHVRIAHANGLIVLTLAGDKVCADHRLRGEQPYPRLRPAPDPAMELIAHSDA